MKFEIDSKLEVSTWDYIGFRIISRSITKVYRRETAGKDLKVILCHFTKPNPKILNTLLPFHTQPSVGSSREVWTWHKIDIRADYTKKSLWKNCWKIHRFTGLTFLHVFNPYPCYMPIWMEICPTAIFGSDGPAFWISRING